MNDMSDTSQEIATKFAAMIAERSPEERLRMASDMFDAARALATAGLKAQNPGITEEELRGQLFLRFYGTDFDDGELRRIASHLPKMKCVYDLTGEEIKIVEEGTGK